MLISPPRLLDGKRRVDQADMGEGLREISQRGAGRDVDLFAEQPKIVAITQQMFEQRIGFPEIAAPGEVFDGPEAADAECALGGFRAIEPRPATEEQSVTAKLAPHAVERATHTRIARIDIADTGETHQIG